MNGKLEKRYISICTIISCVMLVLLVLADARGIFAEDTSVQKAQSGAEQEQEITQQTTENYMDFWCKDALLPDSVIQIKLPFVVKPEDVTMKLDISDGNVTIIEISGPGINRYHDSLVSYLQAEPIRENLPEENVALWLTESDETFTICCETEQLYDGEVSIASVVGSEESVIQISMMRIREKYDKIVVLDAGHGGEDEGFCCDDLVEKNLTLAVVQKTADLLKQEGIQVYCTHTADETVAQEKRAVLANLLHADMLISIHVAQDADSSIYGMRTTYNDTFFIPEFSGADLGYILLEKVAARTNEKVLGMEAETQEEVVLRAEVPVALLEIGYLSNAQERRLLEKEDYLEKIAQGIVDAVLQSYEEIKQ